MEVPEARGRGCELRHLRGALPLAEVVWVTITVLTDVADD